MLREPLASWGAPPGLPGIKNVKDHWRSYLKALHGDCSVFDLSCHFPYTSWLQASRGRMETFNMDEIPYSNWRKCKFELSSI